MDIMVTFEWDPPSGNGPGVVVDNYIITIIPEPVSHNISNNVSSTLDQWSVILDYNVIYTATIVAQNCAEESESVLLSNIKYGRKIPLHYILLHIQYSVHTNTNAMCRL